MKTFFALVIALVASQSAFSSDGKADGCFNLALALPAQYNENGPVNTVYLPVNGTLCVTETNVVQDDEMLAHGKFEISVNLNKKMVSNYTFGYRVIEGATGTIYTTYGQSKDDVLDQSEIEYKLVTFAMRNDHLKPGQVAGHVTLGESQLTLIQK